MGERIPTLEEKNEIVNHLSFNASLSYSELIKILGLKRKMFLQINKFKREFKEILLMLL
jgi:hypothetical protein